MKSKRKIRTVTFHHVLNNGAILQAYALVAYLRSIGYDAKVKNYLPLYFAFQIFRPAKGIKKTITKYKKLWKFFVFRSRYIPITNGLTFRSGSFSSDRDIFAYICGSDQVWNKKLTSGQPDDGYFLRGVNGKSRKIAYAASSGGNPLGQDVRLLADFHSIGVRESVLEEEVKREFSEKEAMVVVDPSLLLKNYDDIANYSMVPDKEYLLTYVVGAGETLRKFDECVAEIKKKFSITVINIGASFVKAADSNMLEIGPSEWVAFFNRATFVCTNSFHGTAFSVNLEKQFLFIPHCQLELNNRQYTLLDRLGLRCREYSQNGCNGMNYDEIDYQIVTPKLDEFVNESKKFLQDSLVL